MTPEMSTLMSLYSSSQRLMDAYEQLTVAGRAELANQVREAGRIVAEVIGKLTVNQQPAVTS